MSSRGAQIPYGNHAVQHATPIAGTAYERGKVTAVQATAPYTYVATDFSAAYADAGWPPRRPERSPVRS